MLPSPSVSAAFPAVTGPESSARGYAPEDYWEARARRYARIGAGLSAVCSYGMPWFYNRAIDLCQRLALRPWLAGVEGKAVLDVGCGVGRWSLELARRGARVTGIDLAPSMLEQARLRARAGGVAERCAFLQYDVTRFDLGREFDLVLAVTVLQHVMDDRSLAAAAASLARHVAPQGRLVLMEVAPSIPQTVCDSSIFRARTLETYVELFEGCGLRLSAVAGVDPVPFKYLFLPYYRRLPWPIAWSLLALLTALSFPLNLLIGRTAANRSWHKVLVFQPRS